MNSTVTVAVVGATGRAGAATLARLRARGAAVVPVSRATGVDLVSGRGLDAALAGVDCVVDTSNVATDDMPAATANLLDACTRGGIARVVLLSIACIEKAAFDRFPYYVAKRAQERLVTHGAAQPGVVRSAQWFEFAENPTAVRDTGDEVTVQDWLIQPVAVDAVADVLAATASGQQPPPAAPLAGPETVRLPDLVRRLRAVRGDPRPVRATAPPLDGFADGALLPPPGSIILPPDVDTWLTASGPPGDANAGLPRRSSRGRTR